MKETVNVNIASQAFTLDDDAYALLKRYLHDIRERLPQEDTETMEDLEARIAEIFREHTASPLMVVSTGTVRIAMTLLGSPDDFGDRRSGEPAADADTDTPDEPRRLFRSRDNRSIAGVCGGLAEFFNVDPTAVRVATLLLILFGGLSIWIYVILWLLLPEEPVKKFRINR